MTGHLPGTPGGPRPIGSVMARLMARTGYEREQSVDGLSAAWSQAAPESIRGGSTVGRVRRGVLEVFVSHSALVQEMGFHKREVLARLGELVPAEGITDIRCRVMADAGRPGPARHEHRVMNRACEGMPRHDRFPETVAARRLRRRQQHGVPSRPMQMPRPRPRPRPTGDRRHGQ